MVFFLIDFMVLLLMVYFFIKGLKKGLIVELTTIIAFICGIVAAMKLSTPALKYFQDWFGRSNFLPYLAYLIVFLAVFFLIQLLGKSVEKLLKITQLNFLNRLCGAILGLFKICFLIGLIFWLTDQAGFLGTSFKKGVISFDYIMPIAPFIVNKTTQLFPLLGDVVAELKDFFGNLANGLK